MATAIVALPTQVTATAGAQASPVAAPTSTPTVTPPPTLTATPEEPGQTIGELLASIERAVEQIRGMDTPPPVRHLFVDQAGMRARIAEELNDPEVVEQIVHDSVLLKLLGVIPQDSDLGAIYESLLGSQVLGLYDPEKEEFFVLGDDQSGSGSLDVEAQLTYAHEYVHRLQDSAFDLEEVKERESDDDMSIAVSALIEGDATTAQTRYMLENFDFGDLAELLESALAAQAALPPSPYFLQRSLEFAYVEGTAFVAELIETGGFAAVDDAFENLPRSTEQVLHPEKYFVSEVPLELDVPDDAMGPGWSVQAENVLGEFFLKTWLEALGSDRAGAAAAGWGGDAYVVFEDGDGGFALGVVIAWDSGPDALEFFDYASDALDEHQDFSIASGGLPGVLEAWWGPGGYVVMSRWDSGAQGDMVAIGITPTGGGSHALVYALSGG
ncbi:MAG: hypothetical protein IIC28_10440 [Chloroflexi bacterium]|nr:hypothetical protein [Chloroflexota bacterium]MCH8115748.1 hypothetical protein [Chloroflexota bacterium]MCI0804598.1 hypothetical protein [Chloroflexota bacterium]MCI0808159.1 hypothetical protein [Chloroflexota bacterium]MCI0836890.1 hypothetical protein [Chloroflexota bacterium]